MIEEEYKIRAVVITIMVVFLALCLGQFYIAAVKLNNVQTFMLASAAYTGPSDGSPVPFMWVLLKDGKINRIATDNPKKEVAGKTTVYSAEKKLFASFVELEEGKAYRINVSGSKSRQAILDIAIIYNHQLLGRQVYRIARPRGIFASNWNGEYILRFENGKASIEAAKKAPGLTEAAEFLENPYGTLNELPVDMSLIRDRK